MPNDPIWRDAVDSVQDRVSLLHDAGIAVTGFFVAGFWFVIRAVGNVQKSDEAARHRLEEKIDEITSRQAADQLGAARLYATRDDVNRLGSELRNHIDGRMSDLIQEIRLLRTKPDDRAEIHNG